jgi:hypothetical protein
MRGTDGSGIGSYIYSFSAPVSSVKIPLCIYNQGPASVTTVQIEINGVNYSISSSDVFGSWPLCSFLGDFVISGGVLSNASSPGNVYNNNLIIYGSISNVKVKTISGSNWVIHKMLFSCATTAAITGTLSFCQGTTSALSSAPSGGTWSSSNATVASVGSTGILTGVAAGTAIITYSGGTCYETRQITVNALPIVTTGSGVAICSGNTTTLTATGASTYTWSPGTGLSATTGASVTAAPTITTTYTVTGTNASGCSNQATVTVTVNAKPTIAAITASPTNLCVGSTINLSAGSVTGVGALTSYNWSGPNSFSTTTSATSTSLTATSTAATGVYTLSVTYPGVGCTSTGVVSSAVTVNALPTIASLSATPSSLCQGAVLSLAAVSTTGTGSVVSYNWTGPNSYSTSTTAATQSYTVPATTASGISVSTGLWVASVTSSKTVQPTLVALLQASMQRSILVSLQQQAPTQ